MTEKKDPSPQAVITKPGFVRITEDQVLVSHFTVDDAATFADAALAALDWAEKKIQVERARLLERMKDCPEDHEITIGKVIEMWLGNPNETTDKKEIPDDGA